MLAGETRATAHARLHPDFPGRAVATWTFVEWLGFCRVSSFHSSFPSHAASIWGGSRTRHIPARSEILRHRRTPCPESQRSFGWADRVLLRSVGARASFAFLRNPQMPHPADLVPSLSPLPLTRFRTRRSLLAHMFFRGGATPEVLRARVGKGCWGRCNARLVDEMMVVWSCDELLGQGPIDLREDP